MAQQLLGSGSAGSGCSSSVSSGLGSISSRCCSRSSVGSGRSGFGSGGCGSRSGCRCFHCGGSGRRSRSGFFLLAAGGEGSSSDQGGQNERVLHFDFPSWTDRIFESHGVRLLEAPVPIGNALDLHHAAQPQIILAFSQY